MAIFRLRTVLQRMAARDHLGRATEETILHAKDCICGLERFEGGFGFPSNRLRTHRTAQKKDGFANSFRSKAISCQNHQILKEMADEPQPRCVI